MTKEKLLPLLRAGLNALRFFALILLTYLFHVCVMPDIRFFDVKPNLILAVLGIVAVCYEKKKTFWYGAVMGILLEVMQPTTPMLSLLLYPIIASLSMLIFSDKSMKQLEYERGLGRPGRNRSPWVRTPLCAAFATAVYEVVNIAYVYLNGSAIDVTHVLRGLTDAVFTTLLALLLMAPVRRFLGIRVLKDPNRAPQPTPYRRS